LAGSWVGMASALGIVLGGLAATIVTQPSMPAWLWRVPFFLAFFSCFIASYLRYRLLESPLFIASSKQEIVKSPFKKIISSYKKSFFINLALAAFVSVYIYIGNIYFVSYLIKHVNLAPSQAIFLAAIGEFCVVLCFPFVALLADNIGYKRVMCTGLVGSLIALPLLFISTTYSVLLITCAQILFGICNTFACAPVFNFLYKLFPTNIRYTGNSTAWSMGAAIFGGTAPLVAEYLLHTFSFYAICLYSAFFTLLSLILIVKSGSFTHLKNTDTPLSVLKPNL
jgi:MHS family proline/betaine transporter-like MFS transporter